MTGPDNAGATEGSPSFGELLRRYRSAAALSQETLAEQSGLSLHGISDLERGARDKPYASTVERLANSLRLEAAQRAALFAAAGRLGRAAAIETPRTQAVVLPEPLSSFVGRERELAVVRRMLTKDPVNERLVTLTGPPGTGKTRLALRTAADFIGDIADGIWFVSLAPIRDPGLVPSALARVLRVREATGHALLDRLTSFLQVKAALLVLDNFEQILAAAPLISHLLESCARLRVLVTSRAALRLYGEQEFAVPPLSLPDPRRVTPIENLSQYESVRLFCDRASAVDASFVLTAATAPAIASICHRLDGLPLAIELAAARSKLFAPQALLARLDNRLGFLIDGPQDRPARQRTLRSSFDWSFELLEPTEQRLFSWLAVFVGGFTIEAVSSVVQGLGEPGFLDTNVVDCIASLVDKSLLHTVERQSYSRQHPANSTRLIMLESVRDYAWEHLIANAQAPALREQHARFFCRLVEHAESETHGPAQAAWFDLLEDEIDNLRAALRWSLDSDADLGLRIGGALWLLWTGRGYIAEGRRWLSALLTHPGAAQPTGARAKALFTAGMLAWYQADHTAARALHEEGLAIQNRLRDRQGIAFALFGLGQVALGQGDYPLARSLHGEALARRRELGDPWQIAFSLIQLGLVVHEQGDYRAARALYEEGLTLRRQIGDLRGAEFALSGLAKVAQDQGEYGLARSLYRESLTAAAELEDRWGVAHAIAGFGELAVAQGQPERGIVLGGAASARLDAIGAALFPAWQARFDRGLAQAQQALASGARDAAWALGRSMSQDHAIRYALAAEQPAPRRDAAADSKEALLTGLHGTRMLPLTRREREVASLIARGYTNREIAAELVIANRTADTHVEHILRKLDLPSRAQVAVWAAEHGLLPTSEG
jgi:predicted ATPase/DNA-binding CsgD family transcriptional regulator/DNA-binding XRE family transcriptional regulator